MCMSSFICSLIHSFKKSSYLFESQRGRKEGTHRDLLAAGSYSKWLQQPGLGQVRVSRTLPLYLGLHMGSKGPSTWTCFCCPPKPVSRKLGLEAEQLGLEPALVHGMLASKAWLNPLYQHVCSHSFIYPSNHFSNI